jgi:gamma-glutamyltranspeptidase/glutathione hydrolase
MVASADQLATQAGLAVLARGGNAVDAAIAANATLAVTAPHLCGMGGDLFALVHDGTTVHALDASGRAGSGADPTALRAEGHATMPLRHDVRSVTVPGCVDGWCALAQRFGRLPLADVFAPAVALAEDGFPASPLLVGSLAMVDDRARAALDDLARQAVRPSARVRRPGAAMALRGIAAGGRDAFYRGDFGDGLLHLANGWIHTGDLDRSQADWVTPLQVTVWDRVVATIPPASQGYLVPASAAIAAQLPLPPDTDDPLWAHLLVEAAIAAAHDRSQVLHEGADAQALVAAAAGRAGEVDPARAGRRWSPGRPGDTTYLAVVDGQRMAVSLIQSNAAGFGSWLVEPSTGINLHNRGLGFSLEPGHPAELAPGRRPPHTLSPLLLTHDDGSLAAVLGTMGGDAQPQILLQLLARLLVHGQTPGAAVDAGRFALRGPATGFDTWTCATAPTVLVEASVAPAWAAGLVERGHAVQTIPPLDASTGHAHAIVVQADGLLAGAADPRASIGAAAGI